MSHLWGNLSYSSGPPRLPLALLMSLSIDSAPWAKSRAPFIELNVQRRALDTCGFSNHRDVKLLTWARRDQAGPLK